MAGRHQQHIDFPLLEREALAATAERANELAARLRSIDPAAAGVSPLAWQRVSLIVMAAWSTTTTTKSPTAAHLTRDQHDRARRTAQRLGLVRITRRYQNGKRLSDAVDVDVGRVDALVALSRAGPPWSPRDQCAQVRPTAPNPCAQVRPTAPKVSALLLSVRSNQPSSTSLLSEAEEVEENSEREIRELVTRCRRKFGGDCPLRIEEALRTAIAAGLSVDELVARCRWFFDHRGEWASEHRAGALYLGLAESRPGLPAESGWPYHRRR